MMRVPQPLSGHVRALTEALATPALAAWPEGEAYQDAPPPAAIAKIIIPVLHRHLLEPGKARIIHLFKENLPRSLAKAEKVGAKVRFLSDWDFTIEYDWTQWRQLSAEQRIALVDHELCHCAYDSDSEKWVLREHDVEEFGEVVDRWGLWRPALTEFGGAMRQHLQTELQLVGAGG